MSTSQQIELSSPPSDAISALAYSPTTPTLLLVASWDKNVYLYDTHAEPGGKVLQVVKHEAPVLSVCWGKNDGEAFSGGLDWCVKRLDLQTGDSTVLSRHEAGVKSVVYDAKSSTLISASWDKTLHIHPSPHETSGPPSYTTVLLPQKPFSLALSPTKLIVGMAARQNHIYLLSSLLPLAASSTGQTITPEPYQRRESSLKFQTRAIAPMLPSDAGYATSSIEGRVAVEWFDPSPTSQARKYAFKCHRQPSPTDTGTDIVYPVNTLAFHPIHGTFASGGGDGLVALWDAVAKRRIRQYQRYPQSIAAVGFSCDGRYLAVASCPGFEDGKEEEFGVEGETRVFVRELAEGEGRGKGGK